MSNTPNTIGIGPDGLRFAEDEITDADIERIKKTKTDELATVKRFIENWPSLDDLRRIRDQIDARIAPIAEAAGRSSGEK